MTDVEIKRRRNKQWEVAIKRAEDDLKPKGWEEEADQKELRITRVACRDEDTARLLIQSRKYAREQAAKAAEEQIKREKWDAAILQAQVELQREGWDDPHETDVLDAVQKSNQYGMYDALSVRDLKKPVAADSLRDEERVVLLNILSQDPRNGPKFRRYSPQSLYAKDSAMYEKPHWTPKKYATLENSMAKLATRLMIHSYSNVRRENCDGNIKELERHEAQLEFLTQRLKNVQEMQNSPAHDLQRLKYPRYRQSTESGAQAAEVKDLRVSLMRLFQSHARGQKTFEESLRKMAYNILVSPHAPDLALMTMMIQRFSRLQQHQVAELVVEALFESNIRPNEYAVASIFNHYGRRRDRVGISKLVLKLQGYHNGLMLADPSIDTCGNQNKDVKEWRGKRIQSINLDPMVFYTMIKAFLDTNQLSKAFKAFGWMQQEGFLPDLKLLSAFLHYFARMRDWSGGVQIWEQISLKFFHEDVRLYDNTQEQRTYCIALRLCSNCDKPDDYSAVLTQALRRGLSLQAVISPEASDKRTIDCREAEIASIKRKIRIIAHQAWLHTQDLLRSTIQLNVVFRNLETKDMRWLSALMERLQSDAKISWGYKTLQEPDQVNILEDCPGIVRRIPMEIGARSWTPRDQS